MQLTTDLAVFALARRGYVSYDTVRTLFLDVLPGITGMSTVSSELQLQLEFRRSVRQIIRLCEQEGASATYDSRKMILNVSSECARILEEKVRRMTSEEYRRGLPELLRQYYDGVASVLALR